MEWGGGESKYNIWWLFFLMLRLIVNSYQVVSQGCAILSFKYFCIQTVSNRFKLFFFILIVVKCLFKDHGNRKRSNVFKIV